MVDLLVNKYCAWRKRVAFASSSIKLNFISFDMYSVIHFKRGLMRQAMELSYVFSWSQFWGKLLGTQQTRELFTMSCFITLPMNSESRPLYGSAPARSRAHVKSQEVLVSVVEAILHVGSSKAKDSWVPATVPENKKTYLDLF